MSEGEHKQPVETKDLYRILLDTRNLEIKLFWQRSNYFLMLNSGAALGFFSIQDEKFRLIFAVMGLLAALLWFLVCLGAKFWQTRWEQRLLEFEKEHMPGLDFFGADAERITSDAKKGFAFHKLSWIQRLIYRLSLHKPSVSYSMIRLSLLFIIGWAVFIALMVAPAVPASHGNTASAKLDSDHTETSRYYAELLSGDSPSITELQLFTNMLPKGGDLHHHYSGAIYAETYLDWVAAQNYCIYRVSDPTKSPPIKKYAIETKPKELAKTARDICISADEARKDNPFYRGLLKHWSDKDYHNHFHEQPAPDQQFFNTFGYFGPASGYSYSTGLRILKDRAKAENVEYMETMLKGAPSIDSPDITKLNDLTSESSDQEIEKALTKAYDFMANDPDSKDKLKRYVETVEAAASGIDDPDFKLRFLAYVSRNSTPGKIFSGLYFSFASAQSSKLIVGVNFVGPENGIVSMRDYTLHMKMFRFLKKRFPDVKIALHAGELALGMVPPEGLRYHISEALKIAGADRIGHGVDIADETDAYELLDLMKQGDKKAIEINLTSNAFILGVKNAAHPLLLYRHQHVPFVISTDDAGVSRNNLSYEYLLYVSRYKPSYDELKKVVYNSIRYSFLSDAEKDAETLKLDKRFAAFEKEIADNARSLKAEGSSSRGNAADRP